MEKMMITCALCGAETTREMTPALPVTPDELAEAAEQAVEAGASIIHLHVRKEDGSATQDKRLFQEASRKIRERCNPIIQFSTGGAVWMKAEERIAPLELQPEMATLTTGTLNFGSDIFSNPLDYIKTFATRMKELGIKPEIEVFDVGMITTALYLAKKGLVSEPLHFDFVMGVPGGIPGTVEDLVHLVNKIPDNSTWSVAGIGQAETTLGLAAIAMGGHVRVGLEDNIYYQKGVLAESNAQLVERMARISREVGREVATPDEARAILGIK